MLIFVIIGCQSLFLSNKSLCPTGLVPIPSVQPEFCVQPYEAHLTPDGLARSQKGVLPQTNVSLFQAVDACNDTVLDGQPLRLIQYDEWLMAGDVDPEKGERFPWGEKDDHRCVITTPETTIHWSAVQPAGSMPDCKSRWGVFDQIGNAWEWVDFEQTATRDPWQAMIEAAGFSAEIKSDSIVLSPRLLPRLRLFTICVDNARMTLDGGRLSLQESPNLTGGCEGRVRGYLWANLTNQPFSDDLRPVSGALLPVRVDDQTIVWDSERDGEPVGAKVGGAFYSGGESTIPAFWIGHTPDFNGSIGFRCVSDPL